MRRLTVKSFEKFNSSKEVIDFLRRAGKRAIGRGSSRRVYRLNNTQVIKVACGSAFISKDAGRAQNKQEVQTTENNFDSSLIAKVKWYHPKYIWVISEYAVKASEDDAWEFMEKHHDSLLKSNIDTDDLLNDDGSQFGWIRKDVVIVDYGFSERIYFDYYC